MALETVLAASLNQSRKKLLFAAVRSNALVAWAFASKSVEYESGGTQISNPLTVGRNPNVAAYSYYEELPVAQTNEFDTVEYNWSRVAGTVIISDQEEDENQGETAIFKLMKAKMNVLEESIREKFSIYLYGSGAGSDPNGLSNLIPDDPTTGTLGTINRATETQWRTSSFDFNGNLDENNIEEAYDDILLDLKLKNDKPDVILCGRNMIRYYRTAVRDKVVLPLNQSSNGKRMADLGFEGFTHNNIAMLYDEDCPINKAYFINSKFLKLHILRHVNMKTKKLAAPWNVDAMGRRVCWQGQWCLWRAWRTHGVVINE